MCCGLCYSQHQDPANSNQESQIHGKGEKSIDEITSGNWCLGCRGCTGGVRNVKAPPIPAKGCSSRCHHVRSSHVGDSSGCSRGPGQPRGSRNSRSCLRLSGSLASCYTLIRVMAQRNHAPSALEILSRLAFLGPLNGKNDD